MSRILITIETGNRRLDAAIPSHLTTIDLLAWMERAVGPPDGDAPRSLLMPDGSVIDEGTCFASAGVLDGMTLRAATPEARLQSVDAPPPREPVEPTMVPIPLSLPERLLVTCRALLGLAGPTTRCGPWARAVSAWRWTDHGRRLRWLIARPAPSRAPVISVSGHRSAEIGERLALAFASTRPEPVTLVDGDPTGRLSRHLGGSRVSWEALARDLADPTLGRLQRDRLLARSSGGLPMVPATEEVAGHIEAVLDALSLHGAIVIVDEGPSPETAPVGDHAVISSIGGVTTPPGAIVAAWGSQGAVAPIAAPPHVPMDGRPYRMLELAATVAGTWAMPNPDRSDDGELR